MTVQLSHAIDLFLHKDRGSFFDANSVAAGSIAPLDPKPALAGPCYHWDLRSTCMPMIPAFQYISHKLAKRGLSIHLIISDHEPYIIPVWQLPKAPQLILAKIARKACSKFKLSPSFLTALASHSTKQDLPNIFSAYRPNSYIVRRSILQDEVIFNGQGLTLLSIDHIYTFKQLLCTLSKKDWLPSARDVCLSSCIHLLQRINQIYTKPPASKAYIARAYNEIEFQCSAYEEVCSAYTVTFCTASIKDVTTLDPDYSALADINLNWDDSSPAAELPDTSIIRAQPSCESLVSPLATVDLTTLQTWETPQSAPPENISPLTYTYPSIPKPSSSVTHHGATKNNTKILSPLSTAVSEGWPPVTRPLSPKAAWSSPPTLSPRSEPLKEVKGLESPTTSVDEISATDWAFPCPPTTQMWETKLQEEDLQQEIEGEAWDPDEEATRDIIESWICDIPAPLKTGESLRSNTEVQAEPLEYVRAWVESWSSSWGGPEGGCRRCRGEGGVERRVTVA